jgi:hypothetical protein
MKFFFVYSSGGGAGDWNAIDRIWVKNMPPYFKDNLLIKFGDIFFNHRSSKSIIKPQYWSNVGNAREWLINNTNDTSILETQNLLMDVGTSKIVSFITHHFQNATGKEIIEKFDGIINQYNILDKYCSVVLNSKIENAVTFDIPNLFKVRTQAGNVSRNLFSEPGCRELLILASAKYANYTFRNVNKESNRLMTIICAQWSDDDILRYLDLLEYTPTKIAIGGLTDYNISEFEEMLLRIDKLLNLSKYNRVHFLGSGGIKKTNLIQNTLGNITSYSVDNTTAYNRAIDGNVAGTSQSGYYDYLTKNLIRISPLNRDLIIETHKKVPSDIAHFSVNEMIEIVDSIIKHQSGQSSHETYDNRAKLIIHNFDVYRFNAEI